VSWSCTCWDFSENDEVEVKAAKKTQASSGREAARSSTSIFKVMSLESSSEIQLGTCLPESCRNSGILSMESGGTRCASLCAIEQHAWGSTAEVCSGIAVFNWMNEL
jgi:hypothetical protein